MYIPCSSNHSHIGLPHSSSTTGWGTPLQSLHAHCHHDMQQVGWSVEVSRNVQSSQVTNSTSIYYTFKKSDIVTVYFLMLH